MESHKAQLVEDDSNKRKHDRIKVETQIQYRVINRQVMQEIGDGFRDDGSTVNISKNGIAMATETKLRKGDYLKIEMQLPASGRSTRALAEVMWAKSEGDKYFSGIRFLIILNEADDHSVAQFISRIQDTGE